MRKDKRLERLEKMLGGNGQDPREERADFPWREFLAGLTPATREKVFTTLERPGAIVNGAPQLGELLAEVSKLPATEGVRTPRDEVIRVIDGILASATPGGNLWQPGPVDLSLHRHVRGNRCQ